MFNIFKFLIDIWNRIILWLFIHRFWVTMEQLLFSFQFGDLHPHFSICIKNDVLIKRCFRKITVILSNIATIWDLVGSHLIVFIIAYIILIILPVFPIWLFINKHSRYHNQLSVFIFLPKFIITSFHHIGVWKEELWVDFIILGTIPVSKDWVHVGCPLLRELAVEYENCSPCH